MRKAGDAHGRDTWWLRREIKKLFHTLFVSWIRVFWVEGRLSSVGLRPHAPLQLLSTTLSHLHHHLLQCSEDKIL